jgi:hypothetical protein
VTAAQKLLVDAVAARNTVTVSGKSYSLTPPGPVNVLGTLPVNLGPPSTLVRPAPAPAPASALQTLLQRAPNQTDVRRLVSALAAPPPASPPGSSLIIGGAAAPPAGQVPAGTPAAAAKPVNWPLIAGVGLAVAAGAYLIFRRR